MTKAILTLVVLLPLSAAPAGAESLTRAEAVARALEANPDVRKSLEDVAFLEGRVLEARADALPDLKVLGFASRYRDPALLNSSSFDAFPPDLIDSLKPIPANLYEGTALIRQTLFSFKVGKALRAAKLARNFGSENVRRVRQSIALEAIRAYNDHLLSLELVRVGEKSVHQKEVQLEMARNRRAAGVATDLEVLRIEVDLANRRADLLALRGQSELALGRLNAIMVRPIDAPVAPADSLAYVAFEVGLENAVREAWTNRPEAKTAALSERIWEQLIGVAHGDALPSLDFDGSYGWSVRKPGNFFSGDFSKWRATVSLTVPVFDGFRTAGKVAQARAERGKAAQDTIALENQIRLEAKQAVDVLASAKSVYQATELNVTQAQKALDMTQANYGYGAATTLDVLDAQAALTQAESTRARALHAHANARALLRWVMAWDPLDPAPGGGAHAPTAEASGTTR